MLLSMAGGTQTVVATSFTPIPYDTVASNNIDTLKDNSCDPAFAADLPRWFILLPYDTYATGPDLPLIESERPMAWEIKAALVWDSGSTEPRYIARDDAHTSRFHLTMKTHLKDILSDAEKWLPPSIRPMTLLPGTSDDTYLDSARAIINSIRAGDFYQVTLLRFFNAPHAHGWENLCALMESNSGPHGALLTHGSRVVASLSPERFVEITPNGSSYQIETWPIKGTAARISSNETRDRDAGEALMASAKDQAELRMIIDLMRNDLARVCQDDSIEVLSSGDLKGFKHVWHLEGHVKGRLTPGQTLGQVLAILCPGGSITGAPKIAAMRRIRSDEGQSRGVFMGNFLRINHDGTLRSNILIRTLQSDNWMASARYAAGSGLVVKSIPEQELLEVRAKCAPVALQEGLSQ